MDMFEFKEISFSVTGVAVPKARARVAFNRGNAFAYTPRETRNWEQYFKLCAMKHKPKEVYGCPVRMFISFALPRPKSIPQKIYYNKKRPDLDNLVKSVIDALNGIFYKDDGQIFNIGAEKVYAKEIPPRVDITIRYFINQ